MICWSHRSDERRGQDRHAAVKDGKEARGFAGLVSLVSDHEEKGSNPAHEEVAAGEHRAVAESDHVEATTGTSSGSPVSDEGQEEKGFSGLPALASEARRARPATKRTTQHAGSPQSVVWFNIAPSHAESMAMAPW